MRQLECWPLSKRNSQCRDIALRASPSIVSAESSKSNLVCGQALAQALQCTKLRASKHVARFGSSSTMSHLPGGLWQVLLELMKSWMYLTKSERANSCCGVATEKRAEPDTFTREKAGSSNWRKVIINKVQEAEHFGRRGLREFSYLPANFALLLQYLQFQYPQSLHHAMKWHAW